MSDSNNFDDELINRLKTVFETASLEMPSFDYDALTTPLNIGITIGAYSAGLAPIIIFALAVTPLTTIFGLTEIGNRRANKMRAQVNKIIEQEPERFTEKQLVAIAQAINITYVSPLWPVKFLKRRQAVAEFERVFNELMTTPINKIAALLDKFTPITFSGEPTNDYFGLKKLFANRVASVEYGNASRRAKKSKLASLDT